VLLLLTSSVPFFHALYVGRVDLWGYVTALNDSPQLDAHYKADVFFRWLVEA